MNISAANIIITRTVTTMIALVNALLSCCLIDKYRPRFIHITDDDSCHTKQTSLAFKGLAVELTKRPKRLRLPAVADSSK